MLKKVSILIVVLFLIIGVLFVISRKTKVIPESVNKIINQLPSNPLQVSYLRSQSYPGSDLKITETLASGSNYKRYIVSFKVDGLTEYGLLTIPNADKPASGFPAIVFNHGYITPEKYTADGNYAAYVNYFASRGYVVFKPDYRGNGKSEGVAGSSYFSSNYVMDDLNAIASIQKLDQVNADKIGIWGHSMGGHITLTDLVVTSDIKAAVIWGGVVGSYNDIIYNWQSRVTYQPDKEDLRLRNLGRDELLNKYGTPTDNPDFWNSIDPTKNLNLVNTPIQIHVGSSDNQVPPDFSTNLYTSFQSVGKTAEYYEYKGADHNISQAFNLAMERSIAFFDKYLK